MQTSLRKRNKKLRSKAKYASTTVNPYNPHALEAKDV
jgi:hypothetical protein